MRLCGDSRLWLYSLENRKHIALLPEVGAAAPPLTPQNLLRGVNKGVENGEKEV